MTLLATPPVETRAANDPGPAPVPSWSLLNTLLVTLPPAALTLVMTVIGIGTRSMWNDEYATWYVATLNFADFRRLIGNVDAVVAPYYVVMHGWVALFGESATSLRLPSALAMAAAAALIALVGRRLFDSGVGITAGLLFAGLPSVSRYGQEARPYSFAIALAVLATLIMLRAVDRPDWRRWILYGGCLIGAGCTHIVTLTVLVPHALYMWYTFRSRGDFRQLRWIAGAVIAVTGILPLAAKGHAQASAIDWIRLNGTAIGQFPEKIFGAGVVAALVTGAAVLAAVLLWARHRTTVILLAAWAVFPPLFCLVTFPVLHLFLHRYLLFTLPAWVLLAAAVGVPLARSAGRSMAAVSLAGLLVVAGVFYLGVPGQQAARHSPVAGEPDFRSAARSIESRQMPGDGIAFAGAGRNGRRAFRYETRLSATEPADLLVAKTAQQIGQFGPADCSDPGRCVGTTRRIWLITSTANYQDPLTGMTDTIQAYLNSAFTLTEIEAFPNVRIFLLNRKA